MRSAKNCPLKFLLLWHLKFLLLTQKLSPLTFLFFGSHAAFFCSLLLLLLHSSAGDSWTQGSDSGCGNQVHSEPKRSQGISPSGTQMCSLPVDWRGFSTCAWTPRLGSVFHQVVLLLLEIDCNQVEASRVEASSGKTVEKPRDVLSPSCSEDFLAIRVANVQE